MAFWGVEVKSGKPFSHLPDAKGGARLHVSQATLGFGTGMNKSVVQCNVGNRSPVFLCSLFPDKSESSQLNLEFEETDEVVFSVIGPRSVHLTGYYFGTTRHYNLDDHLESFGEDIVDTETERSPGVSDEKYDDSFINDDGDLQVIPPSPAFSDGVSVEVLHEGRKKKTKAKHRRLKKKHRSSQSDEFDDDSSRKQAFSNGGTNIMDSEDEDMTVISSLVKSAAKIRKRGAEENAEKDTGRTIVKETKAGRDSSAAAEGKTDAIADNELKRKPHDDAKPKKKMKKQPQEEKEVRDRVEDDFFSGQILTWDKGQQNEMIVEQSSQYTALINGDPKKSGNEKRESLLHFGVPSDENVSGIVTKIGKRKKKQIEETKVVGVGSANGEDQTQEDKARCENVEQDYLLKNEENQKEANAEGAIPIPLNILLPFDDLVNGIVAKAGKRTKKQAKDIKTLKTDNPNNNGSEKDQAQPHGARCEIMEQDSMLKNEENEKHANDEGDPLHLPLPSDELVRGIVAKNGKRKKKKAKEEKGLEADIPLDNISREDQAQPYEARCENIEEDSLLKVEDNQKQATDEGVNPLRPDELVHGTGVMTRKRKKKQSEEEKAIGVHSTFSNFNGEAQAQPNEFMCENIGEESTLKNEDDQKEANDGNARFKWPSVVLGLESVSKPEQKRKTTAKDKTLEADANNIKIFIEDEANINEQNQMQTMNVDFDNNDDQSGNENHNGKKKKKKSKIQENPEALNMDESMNTSVLEIKENNVKGKSKKVSKAKKRDGKVAAP